MFGGLQCAEVVQRAVLNGVQPLVGQVAFGVKEFVVIENKDSFLLPPLGDLLAKQQLSRATAGC